MLACVDVDGANKRMPVRTRVAALMLVCCVAAPATVFAEARFLQTYRDWNVYVHEDERGRTCYVASEPQKMDGNYIRRDPPVAMVAKFPIAEPNVQVIIQSGYPYQEGSRVELDIDGRTFDLFTHGDSAYADDPEKDARIIEAMKQGRTMSAKGISRRGTWSRDTYSLLGFTDAYQAMLRACREKG